MRSASRKAALASSVASLASAFDFCAGVSWDRFGSGGKPNRGEGWGEKQGTTSVDILTQQPIPTSNQSKAKGRKSPPKKRSLPRSPRLRTEQHAVSNPPDPRRTFFLSSFQVHCWMRPRVTLLSGLSGLTRRPFSLVHGDAPAADRSKHRATTTSSVVNGRRARCRADS